MKITAQNFHSIIRSQTGKFSNLELAIEFCDVHATKPSSVVMGDDGRYWVATRSFGAQLERLGYEIAH
jgi:hypothetical protein